MEKFSHIISSEDQEKDSIVYTYEPKIFPIQITKSSNDFLRSQQLKSSDFKISDLVAEQTGIAEKQRQKIESEVEAQTLEKLKDIQSVPLFIEICPLKRVVESRHTKVFEKSQKSIIVVLKK